MTHSQIALFVKIAETGSFTKAGQELNMTQPAVSRAISTLESELEVILFIRDRKNGIILTDIGKRLLVIFRDILNGFTKVEQEVTAEKGFEVGTIRIGSFPIVSTHFLPKILRVIGEKYPRLKFELYEGTIDEIREWLSSRIIDVGWIIPPNGEFEIIPFLKDDMCLLLRDDHPLRNRPKIHINDLNNEPMILCGGGFETPIYELFHKFGAALRTKFDVHNINTALTMIQEGLGIAIVSKISLSLSTLPPNVQIRTITPEPFREINLAVPCLEEASIAVKLFIQTARDLYLTQGSCVVR
ncbi:LysR family transcriptional regulator [Paenibacillus sp. sptzw28]|uniref:LysR family transcriptional regulator n=1 Tax=Paenibacillus sp. sptzw28 TaxID=715179 RepID=UPI001C6F55B8|nr:LysR family transcriptional regulator [Paenibacillus sp. sptzw28]QYR20915.1 LysR family transcriptional regulator [Paenibacillus sp. sptzw28]